MPGRVKKNRKQQKKQEGSFRIIGGDHRSRRLSFPDLEGLRPTTDRVRETVFNWLQNYIPGACVLDLFAGSGALGFEAASRGAKEVQFVELSPVAYQALCNNVDTLNLNAKVTNGDALSFLKSFEAGSTRFDIVFLDPPFRKGLMVEVLSALEASSVLGPGCLVYIEMESELNESEHQRGIPSSWQELKAKKAGQVSYRLFKTPSV